MLKKLDYYFLGEPDEVTAIDRIWFYGTYAIIIITLIFTLIGLR